VMQRTISFLDLLPILMIFSFQWTVSCSCVISDTHAALLVEFENPGV
jgi:hypothetical protein